MLADVTALVALLAEGVDRNSKAYGKYALRSVALLAEGVDRNLTARSWRSGRTVALLAEGVDRNTLRRCGVCIRGGSPSSRRAWIEIPSPTCAAAPRRRSPSSRRAWIEIDIVTDALTAFGVALLAEGVDRNWFDSPRRGVGIGSPSSRRAWIEICSVRPVFSTRNGRPPRGGRG